MASGTVKLTLGLLGLYTLCQLTGTMKVLLDTKNAEAIHRLAEELQQQRILKTDADEAPIHSQTKTQVELKKETERQANQQPPK